MSFYREEFLRDLLHVPSRIQPVAWLCLGAVTHLEDAPDLERGSWRERRPLAGAIHHNRWAGPGSDVELEGRVSHLLAFEETLPAPAQGALAVECRADDAETRCFITTIDDPSLRQAVTAERTFLATLEAGCSFPAAAHAGHFGSTFKLNALVAAAGGRLFRSKMADRAETASGIGRALAEELIGLAELR